MSAILSLLMLLHMAVAFVFVGVFASLMCFSGAPSNRSKAASESLVRRCSDRVARSGNAGAIQRWCSGNSSSVTLSRSVEVAPTGTTYGYNREDKHGFRAAGYDDACKLLGVEA